MSQAARVDLTAWGAEPPQWINLLAREVEQSNRTRTGERIGISRSAVSLVLANKYPSPSTAAIERRVMDALGRIDCVALGEVITAEQCQSYRERKAPTHNPMAMQHWRTCQNCPNNPNCNAQENAHARIH
ncbi:hypothetical protein [Pseudomonas anguilliseptica]|uniref:Uncharacterized protein n=1 Tax=Pseudomonas anguilliseptica TaxID=53406 RepID=A0A1H4XW68_PSEAG|nr:hypothetical protein [Pseudomonas anguilliseptica]SED09101.1 hypothetical protein SAMN05421553_2012 [Pseudomonas anguilliseptica]